MEKLPVECMESILKHCLKKERLNLACSSKTLHALLKPILWQSVSVPLLALSIKLGPFIENFKYTTHLCIEDDLNVARDVSAIPREKSADIGVNVARLISHCLPEKVVSLDTDLSGVAAEYVLEIFHRVKKLHLTVNGDIDGKKLNQLDKLEELQVFSGPASSVNDDTFWSLISGEKLRKLEINYHDYLSSGCLVSIGKWIGLENICISDTSGGGDMTELDVRPLTALINLHSLTLSNVSLQTEDLKQLCRYLRGLRKMDLELSKFTNDALSEIHNLKALDHLSLNECVGISPRCFMHLASLNIRSISISADICQISGGIMLDSDVAKLNKLPALKEVQVYSFQSAQGRNGSAVIVNSLCHDVTWKMRLKTPNGPFHIWTTLAR